MTNMSRKAFTLTEMLVVIGIILAVAIVAVPSFKALTGGRSTEAAQNQLQGILGRARSEAIGLQQVRGVAFFPDRESGRVQALLVKQVAAPTSPGPVVPDLYLDLVEDRDPMILPQGVGVQMVDDAGIGNIDRNLSGTDPVTGETISFDDPADNTRLDDGYIGFNVPTTAGGTVNGVRFEYGGVILFDGYGRIMSQTYGFKLYTEVTAGNSTVKRPSNFAKALGMTTWNNDFVPAGPPRSQFGFVVYDAEAFDNLDFTAADPQINATAAPGGYTDHAANDAARSPEAREERWIDANATPILVNRSNGTLVKGVP